LIAGIVALAGCGGGGGGGEFFFFLPPDEGSIRAARDNRAALIFYGTR